MRRTSSRHSRSPVCLGRVDLDELVVVVDPDAPAVAANVELQRNDPAMGRQPPLQLTPRQRELLRRVAEGRSNNEIAAILDTSVKTVEFHKARIMERLKLRTHGRADPVRCCARNGGRNSRAPRHALFDVLVFSARSRELLNEAP